MPSRQDRVSKRSEPARRDSYQSGLVSDKPIIDPQYDQPRGRIQVFDSAYPDEDPTGPAAPRSYPADSSPPRQNPSRQYAPLERPAYEVTSRDTSRRHPPKHEDLAQRVTEAHVPGRRPQPQAIVEDLEERSVSARELSKDHDPSTALPSRMRASQPRPYTDDTEQGFVQRHDRSPDLSPPSNAQSTRTVPQPLSRLAQGFVDIRLDNFIQCIYYVRDNPKILKQDTEDLKAAAIELYRRGETDSAARCLQRLLMLRHCLQNDLTDVHSSAEYFKDLSKLSDAFAQHRRNMEIVSTAMRKATGNVNQSQNHNTTHASTQQMSVLSRTAEHMSHSDPRRQVFQSSDCPPHGSSVIMKEPDHSRALTSTRRPSNAASHVRLSNSDLTTSGGPQAPAPSRLSSTNRSFRPGQGNPMRSGMAGQPRDQTAQSVIASQYHTTNHPDVMLHDGEASLVDHNLIEVNLLTTARSEGFEVRKQDGKGFFQPGRVFKVMWYQPAGSNLGGSLNPSPGLVRGPGNSNAFAKVMWMLVVVRRTAYSICCPISTYRGQGVLKTGLPQHEVRAHAIIHSCGKDVVAYEGEELLLGKDPIPVVMDPDRAALDPASRVHFGKFHTVEWNVPVRNIGKVHADFRDIVRTYFMSELMSGSPQRHPQGRPDMQARARQEQPLPNMADTTGPQRPSQDGLDMQARARQERLPSNIRDGAPPRGSQGHSTRYDGARPSRAEESRSSRGQHRGRSERPPPDKYM